MYFCIYIYVYAIYIYIHIDIYNIVFYTLHCAVATLSSMLTSSMIVHMYSICHMHIKPPTH